MPLVPANKYLLVVDGKSALHYVSSFLFIIFIFILFVFFRILFVCIFLIHLPAVYLDATSNRKLLVRILKNKGYLCSEAGDGQQALDVFQQMCADGTPPCAVLMGKTLQICTPPLSGGGCTNITIKPFKYILIIKPSKYINVLIIKPFAYTHNNKTTIKSRLRDARDERPHRHQAAARDEV
jgi:pentatricopeptide repeat protein